MQGIAALKRKIERCETIMARTKPIWGKSSEIPGSFETGRSNRSKSLDRQWEAEFNRQQNALREYEDARKEHERLTAILKGVEAGECHPNGQPRADSPSRQKRAEAKKSVEDKLYAFFKAHLQPGQQAGTVYGGVFTVKRVNPKSITSTKVYAGEVVKYELLEVLLLGEDAKPIEIRDMANRVTEWNKQR